MKKTLALLFLGYSLQLFAQKDYSTVYNSYSFIQNGIALYEEGKFSEAISEFDKVAKVDPKFITAQYEKALALVALEKKRRGSKTI
jgi:hypothetical protein